ncbi:hypothetical protein [Sphingobacterium kitahiroshimense]|uniref:hypothetical protein n=1 Tax=Sphingobacterium kitahiroshimense TaxID=470446 RepID=UPI00320BAA4F
MKIYSFLLAILMIAPITMFAAPAPTTLQATASTTKEVQVFISVGTIPLTLPVGSIIGLENLSSGEISALNVDITTGPFISTKATVSFKARDKYRLIIYNSLLPLELPLVLFQTYTTTQQDVTASSAAFYFILL